MALLLSAVPLAVSPGIAAPCPDRLSSIPAARRVAWERRAAPQMETELHRNAPQAGRLDRVTLVHAFREGAWWVLLVRPSILDDAYLFFPGDPATTPYVTQWSGAARRDEGPTIQAWAVKNAPGIPKRLAACFAAVVTGP